VGPVEGPAASVCACSFRAGTCVGILMMRFFRLGFEIDGVTSLGAVVGGPACRVGGVGAGVPFLFAMLRALL
jgi:hypothetical protein